MDMTTIASLSLLVFILLVCWAALNDLVRFEIPNAIPIAIAVFFIPTALLLDWEMTAILKHLAVGGGTLVLGFLLFMWGYFGGGDAKLLAAINIWTGPDAMYAYFFFVAIAGGIFALMLLGFRRLALPNFLHQIAWVERLHSGGKHIPYGVAISSGAVAILNQIPSFELLFLVS